ncbi:MAG TPA: ATP-binding protein [Thermoanaerobaculia bacterium]|nr:ATP-binding protein [Thermoanaerobaculia bacterium]
MTSRGSIVWRYALAVAAIGLAVVLTRALPTLLGPMRLFFLWAAILITALVAGTGPALLALLIATIVAAVMIFAPIGHLSVHQPLDALRLVMFVSLAAGISIAVGARRRAEENARLLAEKLRGSELRYRTLVEVSPSRQAVWTASADGEIEWSEAWTSITGQSREELQAGGGMRMVHPDDAPRTWSRWRDALTQRQPYEDEIRVLDRSGRYHWFSIRAVPVHASDGRILEWVGVIADIHERKRHEDNAAFLNRASELLASSLNVDQTLRNLARLTVPAIADWCAIDLVREGEPYDRLVIEHVDPSRAELAFELDRRFRPAPEVDPTAIVLATGKSQILEELSDERLAEIVQPEALALSRTLGLRSWILAPMIARGRTIGAFNVVHGESGRRYAEEDIPFIEDIAHRAAIAIDNARLFEEAQRANRAKDEFLTTLSHELRTPLTAISGWAAMLQMGSLDEKTTSTAIETIGRSARVQGELIDDLLDLSRVVSGKLHLEVETIDLAPIVEQAVVAAHPAAEAKQLALAFVAEEPVLLVRGDERRLRQIAWNLVSNAVKFTQRGGSIRVTLSRVHQHARVEVSDNGPGIDATFLPHVWERFRQADSSVSREHGGLGLGLAVARELVELHGGTVSVASAGRGQGATFAFELPLARLGVASSVIATNAATSDRPLQGRRILVVDDDHESRTVLGAMLRRFGADVLLVESVDAAMRAVQATAFDAVVTDLAMPGEDGFSLVRRMRETSQIPIVAVSAIAGDTSDRRRADEAGFSEFLRKPVEPRVLANTVARLLV